MRLGTRLIFFPSEVFHCSAAMVANFQIILDSDPLTDPAKKPLSKVNIAESDEDTSTVCTVKTPKPKKSDKNPKHVDTNRGLQPAAAQISDSRGYS